MKLISWNVWEGGGNRIETILGVLRDVDADIVALQECNGWLDRPQKEDDDKRGEESIFEDVQQRLGYAYGELGRGTIRGSGKRYNVVLFSKELPLSSHCVEGMHHAALLAEYRSSLGSLSVVTAHLDPNDPAIRKSELEKIILLLRDSQNDIIVGDLNALSHQDSYDVDMSLLSRGLRDCFVRNGNISREETKLLSIAGFDDVAVMFGKDNKHTMPTHASKYQDGFSCRVDYCWVRGGITPRITSYDVIREVRTNTASDHYPIVVEIDAKLLPDEE